MKLILYLVWCVNYLLFTNNFCVFFYLLSLAQLLFSSLFKILQNMQVRVVSRELVGETTVPGRNIQEVQLGIEKVQFSFA